MSVRVSVKLEQTHIIAMITGDTYLTMLLKCYDHLINPHLKFCYGKYVVVSSTYPG